MSMYGYMVCADCKRSLFLGKALFRDDRSIRTFAAAAYPSLHDYQTHSRVLWKFLADHTGHQIRAVLEHELGELIGDDEEWVDIGGDTIGDVSFEEYLKDWDGYPKW